ncbi:MAG: glycosyltransferase family 2 protein [Thermoleophilia bacterium]
MKRKSNVSVIIPNYERGEEVLECINSIRESVYPPGEIVVVDDCSTDNSVELLRSNGITVVEHSENRGTATARNTGANNSTGEILVFIDSDVVIHEDTIQKCVDRFENDQTVSVIVGMPDKTNKYPGVVTAHFLMRMYFRLLKFSDNVSYTNGTMTAVRRNVFDKIGGYNENLKTPGIEDAEFGLEAYRNNEKIYLDKTNLVTHNKKIDFFGLIRSDMARTVDRVYFMFRKRQVQSILAEKRFLTIPMSQIISALTAPAIFVFLLLTIYSRLFLIPLAICLISFFFLNLEYLSFIKKEAGLASSIKIYLLLLIDMFFVNLAFLKGMTLYALGRRY